MNRLIGKDDYAQVGPMDYKAAVVLPSKHVKLISLLTGSEESGFNCSIALVGLGPYDGLGSRAYVGRFPSIERAAAFCNGIAEDAASEDPSTIFGVTDA